MPVSAGFGARTDHFGIAIIEGLTTLVVQNAKKVPRGRNRADAPDDVGDLADMTHYGSPATGAGAIYDLEVEYVLKAGSINLNAIPVGTLDAEDGLAIIGVKLGTTNGGWPKLTVTGVLGAIGLDDAATWTLPSLTINGRKQAQALGFTVGNGGKLVGSDFEFGLTLDEETDGDGVPIAHALTSAAPAKVTANGNKISAAGSWTLTLTGLVETQPPGDDEKQSAYGDWTAEAEIRIARDAAA